MRIDEGSGGEVFLWVAKAISSPVGDQRGCWTTQPLTAPPRSRRFEPSGLITRMLHEEPLLVPLTAIVWPSGDQAGSAPMIPDQRLGGCTQVTEAGLSDL